MTNRELEREIGRLSREMRLLQSSPVRHARVPVEGGGGLADKIFSDCGCGSIASALPCVPTVLNSCSEFAEVPEDYRVAMPAISLFTGASAETIAATTVIPSWASACQWESAEFALDNGDTYIWILTAERGVGTSRLYLNRTSGAGELVTLEFRNPYPWLFLYYNTMLLYDYTLNVNSPPCRVCVKPGRTIGDCENSATCTADYIQVENAAPWNYAYCGQFDGMDTSDPAYESCLWRSGRDDDGGYVEFRLRRCVVLSCFGDLDVQLKFYDSTDALVGWYQEDLPAGSWLCTDGNAYTIDQYAAFPHDPAWPATVDITPLATPP